MEFELGPGEGLRLLAPGAPDWIGADGVRIGWTVRDRLFLYEPFGVAPRVCLVALPDLVEEVSPHPDGWVVALGQGFVRIDPTRGEAVAMVLDDEADPVGTRAGADVGLMVEVPEHRLLRIADGREVPLPYGASRARRVRPWSRGVGACWVDLDVVYRMGDRIQVVGRGIDVDGLAVGPFGALLASHRGGSVVAAPRQLGVALDERLDALHACFDADGARLLTASEDGAVEVDLLHGKVVRRWEGCFQPLGWARVPGKDGGGPRTAATFLDGDRGVVVDDEGGPLLGGFSGALPSRAKDLLVGPGGRVWNLRTRQAEQGPALGDSMLGDSMLGGTAVTGVTATDGERVVVVAEGKVTVRGGIRFGTDLEDGDDEIAVARIDDDILVLTTLDGETARYTLADGTLLGRIREKPPALPTPDVPEGVTTAEEGEDSTLSIGDQEWPLPADGACPVGERVPKGPGPWWAWTREGMLVQLPLGWTEGRQQVGVDLPPTGRPTPREPGPGRRQGA